MNFMIRLWIFGLLCVHLCLPVAGQAPILKTEDFKHYIDYFNQNDQELYPQEIQNTGAWDFLVENIPFFECPDKQLEQTYYFRWWTYRKHLKRTPAGYIITEFLPAVPWAGQYNSISCPAAHHFYEGRWLRNGMYLKDYAKFWFDGAASPRAYSFWAADAIQAFTNVHPDTALVANLFPKLVVNYQEWEKSHLDSTGLFWQTDNRDGMEVSVSGAMGKKEQGYRATINSYMYGDAMALTHMARMLGEQKAVVAFSEKAAHIKKQILNKLWDNEAKFFKVIPRGNATMAQAKVRELHGFTPWYFSIPEDKHAIAWKQLTDTNGFNAPYGLTTTEQRHPNFTIAYEGHECQWNGPSWPFATSITLTGLANLLHTSNQSVVSKRDYFSTFLVYSRAHQRMLANGKIIPWIDENLNPYTGDWISRSRLSRWEADGWSKSKGGQERGKDYNHSTFCDQVISGIVGIKASSAHQIVINPLIPDGAWEYFCLDNVLYKGKVISVIYDKSGKKYGKGKGFRVYVDGNEVATSIIPQKTVINI